MFLPDHVGQYVQLTAGVNQGLVARAVLYHAANPSAGMGSAVELEQLYCIQGKNLDTSFVKGEMVQVVLFVGNVVIGQGTFLAERDIAGQPNNVRELAFVLTSGTVQPPNPITGATCFVHAPGSNSFANVEQLTAAPVPVSETGTAAWRVLDWSADWGVVCSNATQPAGGVAPMLDALGAEKSMPRGVGEGDQGYAQRVAAPADVVSPNAVRRTLNRVLNSTSWCFREVGTSLLPGFFYDKAGAGDFYDWTVLLFQGTFGGAGVWGFQQPVKYVDSSGNVRALGVYGGTCTDGVNTYHIFVYQQANADLRAGLVNGGDQIVAQDPTNAHHISGLTFKANPYDTLNRHRYYLDSVEFRAMFLVGLPPPTGGDFGLPYDASPLPIGFYDMTGSLSGFYDGYPTEAAALYKQLWDALQAIKAGGVSVEFEVERIGCN
jgi:hypothetical protein